MLRFSRLLLLGGILGGMGLLGLTEARAAPIVPILVAPPTPEGGNFRWTYTMFIAGGERVQSQPNTPTPVFPSSRPDFVVIYDFVGFVAGSNTQPVGTTFSSPLVGPFPDTLGGLAAFDDPTIPNLVWEFTGPIPVTGPIIAGLFSALSTVGGVQLGVFSGETTDAGGLLDNTNLVTTGSVPVPVPEPATVLLVLAGPLFLFGAVKGGLRRRPA